MFCSLPGSSVHGILQARYWSGLPFPSPGDHPNPGVEPGSPALQADSSLSIEKEMATHSSTLVWKTPGTEELGRLQSMGSQRVGHERVTSLFSVSEPPGKTQSYGAWA